jgi:hypothetical protein
VETRNEIKVTILWSQQVQTDRTARNNKQDIKARDNERGTCMLIEVAIPGDRNVIKKEAENILKYTDLIIEIQRMWNVISAVIGATGTISKSLIHYLCTTPGKLKIKELKNPQPYWALHLYCGKC